MRHGRADLAARDDLAEEEIATVPFPVTPSHFSRLTAILKNSEPFLGAQSHSEATRSHFLRLQNGSDLSQNHSEELRAALKRSEPFSDAQNGSEELQNHSEPLKMASPNLGAILGDSEWLRAFSELF